MWKTVLAGTTAVVVAGGALAYAQPSDRARDRDHGWRPSAQDIVAFGDARIAALKAGLQLTPEQEKNWPAMEGAMRDLAKQRADRVAARADRKRPTDPMDRLSRRAEALQSRGAALKKFADAAGPLYNSLDGAQKHRFMILARLGASPFGHRHHGWHGRHHGRDFANWHHRGWRGRDGGGSEGGARAQ